MWPKYAIVQVSMEKSMQIITKKVKQVRNYKTVHVQTLIETHKMEQVGDS